MNGWAENAMREAIDVLSKARRNDLAVDLSRIFKSIVFEDFEIMRSSDADQIADAILEAESIMDLTDCMRRLSRALNVQHCTVHIVREQVPETHSTKVITTYPRDWINTYVNRRYYTIDPILDASKSRTHGFYWDTLECASPMITAFWREAAAHRVGASGYTLPIIAENGDVLALSMSSGEDAQTFQKNLSYHESDIYNLSIFLVEAFCRLASDQRPATFNPTDEQLMILRAISMGCEEEELEDRDYLYGSYATLRRSICDLFRTKTVTQAAVLAARIGLLDNPPLSKGDIMTASEDCAEPEASISNGLTLRRLMRARSVLPGAGSDDERPAA